jgi:SAM-dependent methyltransferase
MKNPSSFYNEAYLKSPMSAADPSLTRWEDNGLFYTAARVAAAIAARLGTGSILDVGCGRGFVVRHLRDGFGYDARGLEYGEAALAHSVCDAEFCDLTGMLPCVDSSYGLIICHGVLSHIPESDIPHALGELRRVAGMALWANVLVKETPTQQHHKTFRSTEWWQEKLVVAGFERAGEDLEPEASQFVTSDAQAMFLMVKG